jgi:hypothetical protein
MVEVCKLITIYSSMGQQDVEFLWNWCSPHSGPLQNDLLGFEDAPRGYVSTTTSRPISLRVQVSYLSNHLG